jgi:hypothetical protein
MNGENIAELLAKFFDVYGEMEFKNVELFVSKLSIEKVNQKIDADLLLIEMIKKISHYTQKIEQSILKDKHINMNQFSQNMQYLKKQLDRYLSKKHSKN